MAAPNWEDIQPVHFTPPGRRVTLVGRKAHRYLERAASDELRQPVVQGYPKGSGFVRDTSELALRVAQARSLYSEMLLSSHPWAHHEADQAKKITLQRGGPPGWFTVPEGLVNAEGPTLAPELSALRDILLGFPESVGPAPRYRRGTSHGWPDYSTSDLSFVLHAMWARASDHDFDDLREKGGTLAKLMNEDTPFSAAMYNRTGPLGKPVAGYSITESGLVHDVNVTGLCCRRRIVYGMPSAGNMNQVPWAWRLKSRQAQFSSLWHYGPADVAEKLKFWHRPGWGWWSDDIAGYDQSVCDTHQRELAEIVISPIAGSDAAKYKLLWKDIPLLGPGLHSGDEGFIYSKEGMTPSGDLLTAFDGGSINFARVLFCVQRMTGRSLTQVLAGLNVWWAVCIQGDDTVLGMDTALFNEKRYVEASEYLGYTTKLVQGAVFLMHHFDPPTGRWAPLASRVFAQSVFNEYPGRAPAVELFSFIARTPNIFWRNNPWAESATRLLADGEPFTRYGVNPQTAQVALQDPVFMADLERELRTTPKRAERFGPASWLGAHVSKAVAQLLDDRAEQDLPNITPTEAWDTAQRIAAFMAFKEDERPDSLKLRPAGSAYLKYMTTGTEREENEGN